MKQPRLVISTLYYENHSQMVVGNVIRVDRGRVVGSDDEVVTIEIRDARLHPKKLRRKDKV